MVPLCPAGRVSPPSRHPILSTREKKVGLPARGCSLAWPEHREGGNGGGGKEGYRGLWLGASSNSFQLLPHPLDFRLGSGVWMAFSPFSHQMCDLIRTPDPSVLPVLISQLLLVDPAPTLLGLSLFVPELFPWNIHPRPSEHKM